MRRNPDPALEHLWGVNLARYDGSLPDQFVEDYRRFHANQHVLSHYRAHARIRRRTAAVAVLRTAWRRGNGRPERRCDSETTSATALAHMLQLRRLCRVRGGVEVVVPFGRAIVAYL